MADRPATDVAGRPVALVTGAAGGIGSATVRELTGAGYRVIALDLRRAAIDAADGAAYEVNLTDAGDVARVVAAAEAHVGAPSLVACIAGILADRPLTAISVEEWRRSLRVHLGGTYHAVRAVVPGMRRRGSGSIVTISTGLALLGHPSRADYVAAKAAIIGFTRALAREVGPAGIRVNCVAPGPIDTTMLKGFGRSEAYVGSLPLGRIGSPAEIAQAIRMVGEAPWTTGQVYSPNGGAVIQ